MRLDNTLLILNGINFFSSLSNTGTQLCNCVCALSLGFLVASFACAVCAYDDVLIVRGVRFVSSFFSSSQLPILLAISHSAAAAALSCTFLRN